MEFEKYFDEKTMSVHLRENSEAVAKKGFPGNWEIVKLGNVLSPEEVQNLSQEIIDNARVLDKSFLEIEREGSTIIQLREYRIVITKTPFSDGHEITIVKPVAKLNLDDYELKTELKERLLKQAEGILISGSPGEGKTTLARALAEHYANSGKIVKTIESPRDLLLSDKITQYSLTYGERDEIYDVLLLSRPDNTIFDEMRNASDFQLFADLRLAGIGMIGIIHATNPIDSIQRFMGRIDMGVIPQVIDTVIFVKGGEIYKVLELKIKIKVPTGMKEADLARPVVEIRDFFEKKLEYEIYTYGEQTIVIPIEKEETGLNKLIAEGIKKRLNKYTSELEIEAISNDKVAIYVPESTIPKIIGRQGKEIEKIEKDIGLSIDVRELKNKKEGTTIPFDVELKKNINFYLDKKCSNKNIDVYDGEKYLLSAKCSKKGMIKVNRQSEIGKVVKKAIDKGTIRLFLT